VNLAAVVPTGAWSSAAGPVRVVTMRDLEEAARAGVTGARPAAGGVELRGLPANQRAVAAQVSRSHREIPPAYFRLTVDARRAVALHSEGIGYAALFVHAAARALERFPRFRDALLGEGLLTAPGVHVAFAVGLEAGGELYAPVLRDAAGLGLADLDARVRELTEAVRARRVSPDGYRGATFLVTNLGAFGVEAFDPVIHPGHSGALAVGAVRRQPVAVREGEAWRLEIRPILTLTLAVDHRLINGIEAAQALSFIRDVVERDDEGGTR
jgi:pyruvate dehydrogenase E2 component (dihydrolipoamide acetyltransferase)